MIDLHIHLLPNLDDGSTNIDAALQLAAACVADGVTAVAATPHVSRQYPTRPQALARALDVTRNAINDAGIPLTVHGGAEVAIDQMEALTDDELRALTIGSGHLLLEMPYAAWPMDLETHITRLAALDIRGILAHPERSAGVQEPGGIERLERAILRGVRVQITAGSLSGRFGRSAQSTARSLVERELAHLLASDAHNIDRRPPRMSEGAAYAGSPELARWLTHDVPHAILSDEHLPPRPEPPKASRRGLVGRLFSRS